LSYLEKTLGEGETVRYVAQVSLWRFWRSFMYGGALWVTAVLMVTEGQFASRWLKLGGVAFVAGLFILLWPFVLRRTTELVITDRRVIAKTGWLSTDAIEIRFAKIESIRVTQGALGRMLGYGTVAIVGTGSTFDPIAYISRPIEFKNRVSAAMDAGSS
jgi:uncharacterized membrane protein YdbT with pleckstrin-like domain